MLDGLLRGCERIAREAGAVLLQHYERDQLVDEKADQTPVTAADRLASAHIIAGLGQLSPEIPVICEEAPLPAWRDRQHWPVCWMVDPLDGTREYIRRSGEFSVNIALIEHGRPILGVVYAPTLNTLWSAHESTTAKRVDHESTTATTIRSRRVDRENLHLICGYSKHGQRQQRLIDLLPHARITRMGSSIKMCLIAQGEADCYPRLGRTSEWDTAAAHCVLERAGGRIVDLQGNDLRYNKRSILNPEFIAVGNDGVTAVLSAVTEVEG